MSSYRVHTSIESAATIKAIGEVLVSAKWNETTKQSKMERAILLPMQCLKAPEVPEAFRAVVESVLLQSASDVLKQACGESPILDEMSEACFTREALCEAFMQRGDAWMSKPELEVAFTASATWARIAGRPEFSTNKTYQAQAARFKDAILKLTGKAVQMQPEICDTLLAKLEDADLETPFGAFVCKRLQAIKAKADSNEFDLGSL